jgi:hypothetical protein
MTKAAISVACKGMLKFVVLTQRLVRCLLLFLCVPIWATAQNSAEHPGNRTVITDVVGQEQVNIHTITLP